MTKNVTFPESAYDLICHTITALDKAELLAGLQKQDHPSGTDYYQSATHDSLSTELSPEGKAKVLSAHT